MATVRSNLRREVEGGVPEGLAGGWAQGEQQRTAAVEGLARPMREYAKLVPEPMSGQLRFDDFPFQDAWYSEEIADAEEVVIVKSTQVGACLAPTTRVLTADLRWVELGGVEEGDELVACDEESRDGVGRRLRAATVRKRWEVEKPAFRILLSDGGQLVASADHRFLMCHATKRAGCAITEPVCPECGLPFTSARGATLHMTKSHGYPPRHNVLPDVRWEPVARLRVGDRLRRVCRTWPAASYEDGWLAGILDGEGHLASAGEDHPLRKRASGAELVISQQHGAVYDRACAYLRSVGVDFGEQASPRPGKPDVGRISVSRGRNVIYLVGRTRPSKYVDLRWWQGLRLPGSGRAVDNCTWPTILAIEPIGTQPLVDIETSQGTFIAEGLVSHNSAYLWRWAVRRTDQFGETTLYVFPTDTHVTKFGDERIEPAIAQSEYLRSRIGSRFVRNKHLKRIGRGFLHLVGSNSKEGAQSVAAQAIVFDEYDLLDPTNLPQMERRITGARQLGLRPRIRRLGTPTIEGFGISEAWESSDKRVWMVPCPGCGSEQEVTWEGGVRWRNEPDGEVMRAGHDEYGDPNHVEEAWRACQACEAVLDVRGGAWRVTNPGAKVIGFHVPRLIVPRTDLEQIIVASRKTKPGQVEAFENNDLGRAYTAAEAQLSAADILAACGLGGEMVHAYVGAGGVTMGVDVAGERNLSVRISEQLPAEAPGVANPRRALWIGECTSFAEVEALIDAFGVQVCVIDSNPERRYARSVQAKYPGRVILCEYDWRYDSDAMKVTQQGEAGTVLEGVPLKVRVNRTEALDAMMDSIRQCRNRPLATPPAKYVDQLRAPKRRTVLDAKGQPKREYVSTGNVGDDYSHAEVYDLVATEMWRIRQSVQQVRQHEERVSDEQIGFRRVRLDRDTGDYRRGFE